MDDDEDVREMLSEVLATAGYHVLTAADGRAALEAIQAASAPPALVILDLLLPHVTGRQVLEALGEGRPFPVVVLTGVETAFLGLAHAPGAAQVLRKPVAVDELLTVVRKWLRRA